MMQGTERVSVLRQLSPHRGEGLSSVGSALVVGGRRPSKSPNGSWNGGTYPASPRSPQLRAQSNASWTGESTPRPLTFGARR
jgi:hypothetical protein